jgi:hypothetical protein
MLTVVLTFMLLIFIVLGMAIGVIFRGQPIKGSCGGIASLGMSEGCDICGGDKNKCDTSINAKNPSDKQKFLSYNAADK